MLQSKPVRNLASLTCVVTLLVAQRLDASGASVAGPGRSNLEPASANLASAVSPGATTNTVEQTASLLMRAPVPAPPQGTPTEKVPPGRSRRPPRPTSTPAPTPTSPAPPGTAIAAPTPATPAAAPAAPAPMSYSSMGVTATDVGVGADGTTWRLGTDAGPGGFNIYRRSGGNWRQVDGSAVRIAVDPRGIPWIVNNTGTILRWNGTAWDTMPGAAIDVGIGADGTVWVLGADDAALRWNGSAWTSIGGGAKSIAVGPDGNPWVVNGAGDIWRHDGKAWILMPGKAVDIAVDAAGSVFVVGGAAAPGGFRVHRWAGSNWTFDGNVGGVRIAAGPKDVVVVAQDAAAGSTLQARVPEGTYIVAPMPNLIAVAQPTPPALSPPTAQPAPPPPVLVNPTITTNVPIDPRTTTNNSNLPSGGSTTSGSLQVGTGPGSTVVAPSDPLLVSGIYKTQIVPGSLACSDGGDVNSTRCGFVPATSLGAFTPKAPSECPSGSFYDGFFGGSCWTCGDWTRTDKPIDTDEACSGNVYVKATRVRAQTFAWDCPTDSFWDGYNGGACYTCPSGYARSTEHIAGDWGCFKNDKKAATFQKNLGCSEQTEWSLGKPKPFPDLGLNKCFSCPTLDATTGEILITNRSLSAADSANACRVELRWKPTKVKTLRIAYSEGAGILPGAGEILSQQLDQPSQITEFLRFIATTERKIPAEGVHEYLEARWAEIAANPNENEALKAMLFQRVVAAIGKSNDQRSPAEQRLIAALRDQAQARQVSVAQDALDMYRAWKVSVEQARTLRARNVSDFFYYGTVPPDFDVASQAGAALGTVGVGSLAFAGSAAAFFANTAVVAGTAGRAAPATVQVLNSLSNSLAAVRAMIQAGEFTKDVANGVRTIVTGVEAAVLGVSMAAAAASIVAIVGTIFIDIAIDQVVAIATAEDKLKAKLEGAQTPIVLENVLQRSGGAPQVAYFWSGMLENASGVADQRLAQKATTAWAAVKAADYRPVSLAAAPAPAPAPAAAPTPATISATFSIATAEEASVLSVDPVAGTVRARLIDSAKVIVVSAPNPALVQGIPAGKTIWADLGNRRASLDGRTACCTFTFTTNTTRVAP